MTNDEVKQHIHDVIYNKIIVQGILNQVEFAKACGVTKQAVAGWLQGSCPDASKIPAICNALNITLFELLGIGTDSIEAKYLKAINENEELKKIIEKYI